MKPKWKLKLIKRTEQYRYSILFLSDDGLTVTQVGRYQTKEEAVARARGIAASGQRCEVVVDVAASFGTGEFPDGD